MLTQRDRVHAATAQEIRQTARQIVLERGPQAASLRAVAHEMGMTAPGLYRYFASRQELLKHVAADILTDLTGDINAAVSAAGAPGEADLAGQLAAACREFRRWSLGHHAVFGMLFGAPLPCWKVEEDEVTIEGGQKFASAFFDLFLELWRTGSFPVPADDEIDPGLRRQLERYRGQAKPDLPLGVVLVFLRCWVRLYGIVAAEVFGRLGLALDDAGPMFELTLAETLSAAGLRCPVRRTARSHHLAVQAQPRVPARSRCRPARPAQVASSVGPQPLTANRAAS